MSEEETNAYREKQERKAEYYADQAARARSASNAAYARSNAISDMIPFGQPILIGHHSEKRARRDKERIWAAMDKSIEETKKAEYYASKAENALNPAGISSDNPDAIELLKKKLEGMEAERERIKARAHEAYELANLSGNMRRVKERITELEVKAAMPDIDKEINGVRMVTDKGENRLRLYFPGIPTQEVRDELKHNGFKWSPNAGAWQRQITGAAIFAAELVLKGVKV